MSLEVEGNGATCVECGVFDFLPTVCSHCHGIFCRTHAYAHLVPGSLQASADSEGSVCMPPKDAIHLTFGVDNNGNSNNTGAATTTAASGPRCALCPSTWCVLCPCPRCGHHYCAAHRFHGHEERKKRGGSKDRGVGNPHAKRGTGAFDHGRPRSTNIAMARGIVGDTSSPVSSSAAPTNAPMTACAPFTSTSPLTVAPPGYRSRMMSLVAIICRPMPMVDGETSQHAKATTPDATAMHHWQAAVCSLFVAVEAAVGQLLARCLASLGLATRDGRPCQIDDQALVALSRDSALYRIVAEKGANSHEASSGAHHGAMGSLVLRLEPLALAETTKDVLRPGETVVVRVGSASEAGLHVVMSQLLLLPPSLLLSQLLASPVSAADAASSPLTLRAREALECAEALAKVAQDPRVRALATRLQLHATVPGRTKTGHGTLSDTPSPPSTEMDADPMLGSAPEAPAPIVAEAKECTGASTSTTVAGSGVPWPFQQPPPLTAFTFLGTKGSPLGMRQVTAASAPTGRVVVAVFVQDTHVKGEGKHSTSLVIALGKGWPVGKVRERVREEVAAAGIASPAAALVDADLFYLGSSVAPGACDGEGLPLSARVATSPLKDGDVLFLGYAATCAPGSALASEVAAMRRKAGKPRAAQQMELMRKCSIM